ncbi:MAG TPA: SAF domain-containing protein, partial [Anaerolineales bacterium]|nr:SAF domain-containing protein [Anaerolineales bacterium]
MLTRIKQSGLNLLVLGASALVFVAAFGFLTGYAQLSTPETTTILVAARSLGIGDRINPADLREQSAFLDETTAWYFSADEADDLAGALVALPIRAGQPVPRDTLIAGAAAADRFGALLADFPGHSLFPLPLDQPNVIAPPAAAFLPGDVVGITVVIEHRPQPPATPTPDTFAFTLPGVVDEIPPVLPTVLPPADPEEAERGFPPLAKDLFPGGIRVITVQGLP